MGASNSLPVTSKFTDGEENDRIKYAVSSMQGWSEKMEDAHAAILHLDDNEATSFFGVYDGLGGSDVASYCARQFHIDLRNHEDYHNNVTNAMKRVFFSMDEKLQQSDEWREEVHPRGTGWMQFLNCANLWQANYTGPAWEGSTACAVIIRGNRIVVGNVGDSRCVLSRNGQAINLSTDHKPERYPEIRRVRKAGGVFVGYSRKKGMREEIKKEEWARLQGRDEWGFYKHYGKVSVSRAIGYFAFKQNKNLPPAEQMLICNPEMRTIGITDDTEFLLIASNSIWECKSSQQVVDFVRQRLQSEDGDLRAICEDLLELGLPSGDNMTAILVQFKAHNRHLQLNPEDEVQPCLDDLDAEDTADSGAGGDVQAWQRPFANPRDENLPSLDYDADDPAFSGADVGVSRRPFSNPEDEIQPSLD